MDDENGDVMVNTDHSDLVTGSAVADSRIRCDICERRLGKSLFFIEETGDVPDERRSWTLCEGCHTAVREQLAISPVRTPLRLRVAVGLVASERTPEARRTNFGQLNDESWFKVFFWLFPITMIVHLLIVVAVAGWFR
jgi:hypothetical protein